MSGNGRFYLQEIKEYFVDIILTSDIPKALYYLQKIGDLNLELLKPIPELENITRLLAYLKSNYDYASYPLVRAETIGLNRYVITLYSNFLLNLHDIYSIFDESTAYVFRNVLNPYVINILLYTTLRGEIFTKPLDYLQDCDIIYHYTVDRIYDQYTYPIDYSHFDFERKEFKLRKDSREPFTPPRYNPDINLDKIDLLIVNKKQSNPKFSIDEIAKELNIQPEEAINHLQEHVNSKGLISSYVITLQKPNFVILVEFGEKSTIDYLSKIPELFLIFQTRSSYLAYIVGRSVNLISYINHITRLKREDSIELSLNPVDEEHCLISPIPVKHFNGKWSFKAESMMEMAEKVAKSYKKKR